MFKEQKAKDVSDDFASYICGVLLQGGSDTTAAEFVGFIQAMVLYPEVQKRAQAEVDEVCADRLPTLDDMQLLPYVRACVKEVCRWMYVHLSLNIHVLPKLFTIASLYSAATDIDFQIGRLQY